MKTMSYRLLSAILLVFSLALSITAPACAYADDAATPTLGITHAPAYGSKDYVMGKVQVPEGVAFNPNDYHVTAYVEVPPYGCYVKPTQAKPYVDVLDDGTFALQYDSGGDNDRTAPYLHVLLIPADYTPTMRDFASAKAVAYDYVKITRDASGTLTVDPADRLLASPGKPSGLSVSDTKIAVGVGLYTSGNPGDTLSEEQIATLLTRTAEFADTVRFYRAGDQEYKAYKIAHDLGLKVVGTALLTGNATQDRTEMDTLIELCNAGYVQVACVGNETLYAGTLTEKQLVEDIAYVRSRLNDDTIPVTTSETLGLLIKYPLVRSACDILMPNTYPFWEGTSIDNALGSFAGALEALASSSPNKEIVVSETGWPTAGNNNGSAVVGESQARTYFDGVRQWSLDNQTVVLWFAAVDEPWKSGSNGEGSVGAHWGLLDTTLHPKEGFADLELFTSLEDNTTKLLDEDVTVQDASYTYDGTAKTPEVSVTHDGVTLTKGTHYVVSYQDNTNAGTAYVVVRGVGTYEGTVTKSFAIDKAEYSLLVTITAPRICVGDTALVIPSNQVGTFSYASSDPKVATVSDGTITAVGCGTATITVTDDGGGNYNPSSRELTITVICAKPTVSKVQNVRGGMKVTWKKVPGATAYRVFCKTGTGSWKKVGDTTATSYVAKTSNGRTKLKTGTKYTFTVRCIQEKGSNTYISDFDATGKKQVYVASTAITRARNVATRKAMVRWKKVAKASGYKVQLCRKKSFASGVKTVTVKGGSKVSATIKSLAKGKTYYVRVRAYKKVSGKTSYSAWSTVKSVKVRK